MPSIMLDSSRWYINSSIEGLPSLSNGSTFRRQVLSDTSNWRVISKVSVYSFVSSLACLHCDFDFVGRAKCLVFSILNIDGGGYLVIRYVAVTNTRLAFLVLREDCNLGFGFRHRYASFLFCFPTLNELFKEHLYNSIL